MIYATLFFSIFLALGLSAGATQCRNDNNEPVDWFVLYKIPKVAQNSNPLIKEGVAYQYITSKSVKSGWKLSKRDITSANSIPGYTLAPLYNDTKSLNRTLWLMYNDQPPNRAGNAKYGHTKGVVYTDAKKGFWLIHSVPNYPSAPNGGTVNNKNNRPKRTESNKNDSSTSQKEVIPEGEYYYPDSGKTYGQSFLCISTDIDTLDMVGKQLMINQIIVFVNNVPDDLAKKYPQLANAALQKRPKGQPTSNSVRINSSNSMDFISFAKNSNWQKDLYDDFVAPELKTDLLTETWLNGRGRLPSECNSSKVMNIESINLKTANVDFKSSHDHSKWAVASSNEGGKNWVCVGDINRADTQFNRGGGTVCLNTPDLWKNYREVVSDVEPCPRKKTGFFQKIRSWFT